MVYETINDPNTPLYRYLFFLLQITDFFIMVFFFFDKRHNNHYLFIIKLKIFVNFVTN